MSTEYLIEYDDVTPEIQSCQPGDTIEIGGVSVVVEEITDGEFGVYVTGHESPGMKP